MSARSATPPGVIRAVVLAGLASCVVASMGPHADEIPETIVFGGDAAYPPFEWLQDGTPTGFNIDLENAIAAAGGARAEHRLGNWPDTLRALENGDVDVVPMFRSESREQLFTFTSTFQYVHHAVFALAGAQPVDAPEDLSGHHVVVETSSYAHDRLLDSGMEVELSLAANTHAALQYVADGHATYALLAVPATFQLIRMQALPIQQAGVPMWPGEYAFAVRRDREDLARWLRQNHAAVVGSGGYNEIQRQWAARMQGHTSLRNTMRDIAVVFIPLAALALAGAFWMWSLRRTVYLRTRELQTELQRREAAETHLRYLAEHDPHTGLLNTLSFVQRVDQRLQSDAGSGNREILVMKLIERGKVGRVFGHDVSEELVRRFAARLSAMNFAACGYLGRGRFAVFSDDRPVLECFDVLSGELMIDDLELHPSIVGGLARLGAGSPTALSLVRHAEIALSVSLSRHLQYTVFDTAMEPDPTDLRIVMDFRKTGGRDLFPVFQPQIDLATGAVVAAEALVRWEHPQLGLIAPVKFIPLLESVGLVTRVTQRMVEEAARVAAHLRRIGRPCPISINVSAYDLVENRLAEIITAALKHHGAIAADLQIELTETSVAEDPGRMREALLELSALGLRICIDDFGTGHSSLSYLSSFPIQELKIDQEFVFNIVSSARNRSIVRSTIFMAHELGMTTVAEGAEDEQTLDMLREAGCDRVQGYVISRPLPEAQFLDYVADCGKAMQN